MRAFVVLLLAIVFFGFSCKKNTEDTGLDFNEQLALDSAAIADYLTANNITDVMTDQTGYLMYVVHEEGDGVVPLVTDSVVVSYVGRLLATEEEFDSGDHSEFKVNGLITGWQIMLGLMHEGDSVTIYVPSGFAYGKTGSGDKIPANANLIFGMKLHKVFQ
ncbi:MAG: FKBP-type peptidyl-prolyl cis-trans isomerase [Cyclobacteriaceae bacterium]|nr:FKBP-type peptidyl-prolyl cis-trans isomerase [Cyclobacteriaceae bacterium]